MIENEQEIEEQEDQELTEPQATEQNDDVAAKVKQMLTLRNGGSPAPQPAEKAQEPQQQAKAAQTAQVEQQKPKQNEPFPGFSSLSPEYQKEFLAREKQIADLNARYKAQLGQLQPIQRQNELLSRRLKELERVNQKPLDNSSGNVQPMPPTATSTSAEKARWKQYKEQFPDEAEALEERMAEQVAPILEKLKALDSFRTELEEREEKAERIRKADLALEDVKGVYRDYDEIIGGKEFQAWIADPENAPMLKLFNTDDALNHKWVMRNFLADTQPSNASATQQSTQRGDEIASARQKQMQTPATKVRGIQSPAEGDDVSHIRNLVLQEQKRRSMR